MHLGRGAENDRVDVVACERVAELGEACGAPYLLATSWACSSRRLTTEVTVTPSIAVRASRCLMPKAPAPARAMRMI
jgi:hypothetical protein